MGCAGSTGRWSTFAPDPVLEVNGSFLRNHSGTKHHPTEELTQDSITDDAIAIVGIGCRTPGADNIKEYWRLLQNGECHVTDVPEDRWNAKAFLDPDAKAPGKAYVQKGGFMKDIEGFDNGLFGINDFEASHADPQQCLLLECTNMALEDAGFTRKYISGTNTGVFVGCMHNDHGSKYIGSIRADNYAATGISTSILASRLSYVFNLLGPCMVLDTACSVSLVAIHQGCQAIRCGDCNMAICGGVNCMLTPDVFILLSKARMISPTGLCHTFSEKADGYTRGEGCGIVILKRLKDAVRDGDKVWATVWTGTNQDGHSVTPITAPSGEQQRKLLEIVYDRYQLDVSEIDYIEAHGTGTPAGDPVETHTLGSFYKERGQPKDRFIGSAKTNIGHTESAAGVLGLIKVLLMVKHNTIVPSLHCEPINPKIDLAGSRFIIPTKTISLQKPLDVAACNCFGFGGSNAHAVVRSFMSPVLRKSAQNRVRCIVCFSGKTLKALKGSLEDFYMDDETPLLNIHDVSYTSTARRDHHFYRAAFIAEDMDEMIVAVGDRMSRNVWAQPSVGKLNIVFVFCGMGTSWEGMCRQLFSENKIFRNTLLEVEKHLLAHVPWYLTERLQQEDPSKDSILDPIAIFACQVGLAAVWQSLGIKPSCVVGQSIGEVAAAYCAGSLSLADAVQIIYHRSQLLAEVTGGAMVVVQNVQVNKVKQVLNEMKDKASVALEYSPRSCAVSADSDTMSSLRPKLLSHLRSTDRNMRLVDLDVCVAYHSSHVSSAAEKLKTKISGITSRAPKIQFLSTVTGEAVTSSLRVEHWADNIKKPVLFHKAVTDSVSEHSVSNTVFLEIGPKPVLRAHMNDLFPDGQCKTVPSITFQSETKCLYQSLATLYEHGADIDWKNLPSQGNTLTPVPRYSFDKKYLREKKEQELLLYAGCNMYKKNHLFVIPTEETPVTFRLVVSPLTIPSVYQHVVMGRIVIPGALYAECGFALARYIHRHTSVSISVEFQQLLPLGREEMVGIEIVPKELQSDAEVALKHFIIKKKQKQLAVLQLRKIAPIARKVFNLETIRSRCPEGVKKPSIYGALRTLGFEYGSAFSLLEHAHRGSLECLATLQLNNEIAYEMTATTIHPCILDCLLQSAILVLGGSPTPVKEMLPKSISGLSVSGAVQPVMFVHTRLKTKAPGSFTFEMKLLSLHGEMIAEITDFTVQSLTSQEQKLLPDMLALNWEKVKDISQDSLIHRWKERKDREQSKTLLLVSEKKLDNVDSCIKHIKYDSNSEALGVKKELKTFLETESVHALVLKVCATGHSLQGGEEIQSRLINICFLIQSIFIVLRELSLSVPVYICTSHAWPSVNGDHLREVDPSATAVWGLIRTVMDEHVYFNVTAVDLHTSTNYFAGPALQALLYFLMTDKDISDYPEVLITEEAIYINQVSQLKSSISLPATRPKLSTNIKDVDGNALILSEDSVVLSKLQAIDQERSVSSSSGDRIVLRANSFAKPPETLFSTRLSCSNILPDREESHANYVVMALEVTGHVNGSEQELTSCCPVTVGTEVSISLDTALTTASLPQYQAGDLSKLTLFWSLVDKVPTRQFTVLASRDTMRLAELVKMISCDEIKRKSDDVNIVSIHNLKAGTVYHATILSLILLDVNTMSMIAKLWKNAQNLVSFSCLVTKDLPAFMICVLADVQLLLLDTQLIFQFHQLKKTIPNIKEWMGKNTGLMSTVSRCIHLGDEGDNHGGIHELLNFQCLNLQSMSIQIIEDKLFRKDGIYLVVGGLTGLGWVCVNFLAQNNAGYIAIINRRAPSQDQRENIVNLSHHHDCKIKAFQANISSKKSLEQILLLLSDEWANEGQLRGVFIGAAVLQDGFFPSMERSAFEKVLSPKVQGTWNLHQLTKDLPLDYFVMHSSVASVMGNSGQANYSTGNAFLDGVAFHRRHLGLAAQTINWGPLDIGLLENQDVVKQKLDSIGLKVANRQDILDALQVLMLLNWPQSIPLSLNKELYTNHVRATSVPSLIKRFQQLLAASLQENSGTLSSMEAVQKIRFLEPGQRVQQYEVFVRELTSRILSVDIALVTNEVSLFDLGLDSVTGMTLVSVIERDTSFKLSAVSIFSGEVTVPSLAAVLDECASEKARD